MADYNDICAYLSSIGATKKEIETCPQTGSALRALAEKYGGDLTNNEAVKKAAEEKKRAETDKALAARQKKIRCVDAPSAHTSDACMRRLRTAAGSATLPSGLARRRMPAVASRPVPSCTQADQ